MEKTFSFSQGPNGFVVQSEDEQTHLFSVTPDGVKVGGVDVPPLLCSQCKTLFELDGTPPSHVDLVGQFRLTEDGEIDWKDVQLGPCPTCGGKGVLRQSLFKAAKESIATLSALDADELVHLREQISALKATSSDPQAVADALATTPLGPIASAFASQGNRSELWAFIQVVLAGISIILATQTGGGSTSVTNNITITQVIPTVAASPDAVDWRKVHRNGTCPCGSGLKAKKCHLFPEQLPAESPTTNALPLAVPTPTAAGTTTEGPTTKQ